MRLLDRHGPREVRLSPRHLLLLESSPQAPALGSPRLMEPSLSPPLLPRLPLLCSNVLVHEVPLCLPHLGVPGARHGAWQRVGR